MADRAGRRVSRVTASEFDSLLRSNETVMVTEGRDERLLGHAPPTAAAPELDDRTAAAPPALPPKAAARKASAPPSVSVSVSVPVSVKHVPEPKAVSPASLKSPKLVASDEVNRRSMHRGPGTASSPDLATLVRKAKEASGKHTSPLEQDELANSTLEMAADGPPPLAPPAVVAASPVSPPRALQPRRLTSPASSPPPLPLRTPTVPPPVPAAAASTGLAIPGLGNFDPSANANANANARKQRLSVISNSSYVHVPPSPVPPSQSDSPLRRRASKGTPDLPTLDPGSNSPSSRKSRPGSLLSKQEDEPKSSFSNTMRKTSRFFKRFGAGPPSSAKPAGSPLPSSAPATPVRGLFSPAIPPPLPPIPNGHAPLPALAMTTPPRSRPSVDSTTSARSPNGTIPRDGSNSTLNAMALRRRSVSLGSLGAAAALAGSSPTPPRPRHVSRTSEDAEQFRSELNQWKLAVDGALGSVGDSTLRLSPNLSRVSSAATPAVGLPSFSPLAMPFAERSSSTPPFARVTSPLLPPNSLEHRRPTWDANWAKEHPEALSIHAVRSPLAPFDGSRMPAAQTPSPLTELALPPREPYGTPSIRLVSPTTSTSDLPDDGAGFAPNDRIHVSGDHEGVGLGLETISESKHSRQSSLATPPRGDRSPSSSPPESAPPLVFTQGASPVTNGLSSLPSFNRKQLARQSVVAYPRTSSGLGSASTSKSGSVSSLASDPGVAAAMRRGRTKSGDASSGAEDGKNEASATGTSLEERAISFAQRCWDEDPDFMEPKKIAEWLGSTGRLNVAALRHYIDFFDFTSLRLDLAFRRLCEKLYLKAETQQVDRILEQFSRRYWENNPTAVYGGADVVHAVAYSLLLLNTDLHVVESTSRMSRAAFVKNTVNAIQEQIGAAEAATPVVASGLLFGSRPADEPESTNVFGGNEEASQSRKSLDRTFSKPLARRSGSGNSWKKDSSPFSTVRSGSPARARTGDSTNDGSPAKEAKSGMMSQMIGRNLDSRTNFDSDLEANLKEMYTAIKSQPIFQPLSSTTPAADNRSSVSLTPGGSPYGTWGGVSRSGSRRSAASSNMSGSSTAFKRSSVRGFGSFLGASSVDLMRPTSPTPSTATSLSDDNLSTAYGAASSHHHVPTIGFASNLSSTMIREQQEDDQKSETDMSVTDEELSLLGAPWAKEGLVFRKHYWDSAGKRAKEKSWLQVFVVISQGEIRMFRFDTGGSSKAGQGGAGVGGGDWTSSAQSVGSLSLTHALCSSMPPPGYSRDRPHCFVLTLPGGGTYFFQAGTQDLVAEWVSTCNYWSARLSKEPLSGGVSNMEYGWNRIARDGDDDEVEEIASIRSGKSGRSGRSGTSKASFQGSTASSYGATVNDRISIADWKPPNVPTGESKLAEEAQLDSLKRHVEIVRGELAAHNTLRAPMSKLFSPRSLNQAKSAANWERKSQHLLSELVKYQTYIDQLERAMRLRALRRGQKEVENMLSAADDLKAEPDEEQPDTVVMPATEFKAPNASPPLDIQRLSSDSARGGPRSPGLSGSSVAESNDDYYEAEAAPTTPTSRRSTSEGRRNGPQ